MRRHSIWAIWVIIFPKLPIQLYIPTIIILPLSYTNDDYIAHSSCKNGCFLRVSIWAILVSRIAHIIAHMTHVLLTNVSVTSRRARVWAIMGNLWVKHGQFSKAQLPILFDPQIGPNLPSKRHRNR